ncbi:MAG: diaminopimelate epimerase [Flavobacteriales bacterium AspAUS03]
MKISFSKYEGTGNDFILLDARMSTMIEAELVIEKLCQRRWGIGADGFILIKDDAECDFYMKYYNADGRESSMCGNGGRCAVAFSKRLGMIIDRVNFKAIDGNHTALIQGDTVSLQMIDVSTIEHHPTHVFLNTGSPHHVVFVPRIDKVDVYEEGKKIRFGKPYFEVGSNVNFVQMAADSLKIRTYERGVENETLSCGTGVVAAAIAAHHIRKISVGTVRIETLGGILTVRFTKTAKTYETVWLEGPARFVFEGCIEI